MVKVVLSSTGFAPENFVTGSILSLLYFTRIQSVDSNLRDLYRYDSFWFLLHHSTISIYILMRLRKLSALFYQLQAVTK